jgi:gamma-glutamyltranspeptidase
MPAEGVSSGGAALSSPLLFEDVTAAKTRGFLAATTVGTLGGASIAYLLTRGHEVVETAMTSGLQGIVRRCDARGRCTLVGAADPRREGLAIGR